MGGPPTTCPSLPTFAGGADGHTLYAGPPESTFPSAVRESTATLRSVILEATPDAQEQVSGGLRFGMALSSPARQGGIAAAIARARDGVRQQPGIGRSAAIARRTSPSINPAGLDPLERRHRLRWTVTRCRRGGRNAPAAPGLLPDMDLARRIGTPFPAVNCAGHDGPGVDAWQHPAMPRRRPPQLPGRYRTVGGPTEPPPSVSEAGVLTAEWRNLTYVR